MEAELNTPKALDKLMTRIVEVFLSFNTTQLKVLLKVGFCLSMSPVTYIDESPASMPHFRVRVSFCLTIFSNDDIFGYVLNFW